MGDAVLNASTAPFGSATRLFDRALPAAIFGTISILGLRGVVQSWTGAPDPSSDAWSMHALTLVHGGLAVAFSSLVTVLFLIRRPPSGTRASLFNMCVACVGSYVMWIAILRPTTTDDWRTLAIADLLMIGGLAFTIYALLTLRACFGVAPEARGLVTSGPYGWVRHPVYLGEFVTAVGGLLPVLSPVSVLVFTVFCLAQARRMALEESVLSAAFSDYTNYRRCTPAVLPRPRFRSSST